MEYKKIQINPRIIKHLGKDLITTSDVAVVELVKNSIDARAQNIRLHLFESLKETDNSSSFLIPIQQDVFSFIPASYHNLPIMIIEDDGSGMDTHQLEKGFLEIGTDMKLDHDDNISLGEKGIGRLAAQRLGKYLVVETASCEEQFASLTFIDWSNIVSPDNPDNYSVPYQKIKGIKQSYTRLWIIDIKIDDFIETPMQLSLDNDNNNIIVNRELKSALNFLISPFTNSNSKKNIELFLNNRALDIGFPSQMLSLSESRHSFELSLKDSQAFLNYSLNIKPWFLERMHRVLVKPEAFKRLKKSHEFYKKLLEKSSDRISNVLDKQLYEEDLCDLIADSYEDIYANGIKNKEDLQEYAKQRANGCIQSLKSILPMHGEIFTFKQNAAVGDKIIIESVKEQENDNQDYTLKGLKSFLENYNGIKLYRDSYRIGFLGDKENDWIKLQQFRTKGQQWFRFDLGNTVGYVSITDPFQKNIQEISSRLDISQNEVSDSFKLLINIIFNKLFYDLNRTANSIVKVILEENGLLGESVSSRVKKNTTLIQQMVRKNRHMLDTIHQASDYLLNNSSIDGDIVKLPKSTFDLVTKTFGDVGEHFIENQNTHTEAVNLLTEAGEQLKAIEVESYNNYKLMANGLITETITHELHSLSKTGIDPNINTHFEYLKDYFLQNKATGVYNQHVYPVKSGYDIISGKMLQVADLYSFLENTFIKKGTYDEFIHQNIANLVDDIQKNLIRIISENKIAIECTTKDLTWFVPKGVLLHVFYNLFNNSIYWIDERRKFSEFDLKYSYNEEDKIFVEEYGSDGILVYDTGTGVLLPMEDILFEPLQSGKPHHEGRGMGLYIVKKLMNSFDGNIELLPDRNSFGNRFKFLITISNEGDK